MHASTKHDARKGTELKCSIGIIVCRMESSVG